ncbi:MAG: putative proline hydroxylase [Bacteroidota bacterium]|jgi:Rps23 Pro-64 3,4-dihydroxylase Tpa1-like proline 4-hydroxylase|nr:putative proline hydroxylase [Bacteroidota bacterium]
MLTREQIADLIFQRLQSEKDNLKNQFQNPNQINSCIVDDLLPEPLAHEIFNAFPAPEKMGEHRSLRENKKIAAQLNLYHPILEEITFAFQDPRIVSLVEEITGIKNMEPDSKLYAGGISLMSEGNFLNPHLDNSHDSERQKYRVLNLLYYVSPNWKEEYGGNLELWDRGLKYKQRTIVSKFNRLVLMITNKTSYHSVSKVVHSANRCCVSNYYFSDEPAENEDYFHVTTFYGRPEEPIKRFLLPIDAFLRQSLRKIFKKGVVKTKHIYKR